jgi:hypothetical protein
VWSLEGPSCGLCCRPSYQRTYLRRDRFSLPDYRCASLIKDVSVFRIRHVNQAQNVHRDSQDTRVPEVCVGVVLTRVTTLAGALQVNSCEPCRYRVHKTVAMFGSSTGSTREGLLPSTFRTCNLISRGRAKCTLQSQFPGCYQWLKGGRAHLHLLLRIH